MPAPVLVPGGHDERGPSGLSPMAHLLCTGLFMVNEVTVGCSRFACRLIGSADRLIRRAATSTDEISHGDKVEERPSYSLHWIYSYENDVWN